MSAPTLAPAGLRVYDAPVGITFASGPQTVTLRQNEIALALAAELAGAPLPARRPAPEVTAELVWHGICRVGLNWIHTTNQQDRATNRLMLDNRSTAAEFLRDHRRIWTGGPRHSQACINAASSLVWTVEHDGPLTIGGGRS